MYKAILQLTYSIHPQTMAGIDPSYNKMGKAIATIDGSTEAECERKVAEFITENEMVILEKKAK